MIHLVAIVAFSLQTRLWETFGWKFDRCVNLVRPNSNELLRPYSFSDWAVVTLIDHTAPGTDGHPGLLTSRQSSNNFRVIKSLLDTKLAAKAIAKSLLLDDFSVRTLPEAAAVCYATQEIFQADWWKASHRMAWDTAQKVLRKHVPAVSRKVLGVPEEVALICLGVTEPDAESSFRWLERASKSASGRCSFLSVAASLDLCRRSIVDHHPERALACATWCVGRYPELSMLENYGFLRAISLSDLKELDRFRNIR